MKLRFWRNEVERSGYPLSMSEWMSYFTYNNVQYPLLGLETTYGSNRQEAPANSYPGYARMYQSNGVVFACAAVRMSLFSEARFQFRRIRNGRPGDLFGNQDLGILERPWPNGTTGDLLARMEQDITLMGNFFATVRNGRLRRMRPDWVTIVLGSLTDPEVDSYDLDAEVVGYLYHPGGINSGEDPVPLRREVVAHYAPKPDPMACYRGMSWLTPVVREVMADAAATDHKSKFFENGATPNLAVKMDPNVQHEGFKRWVEMFKEQHEGVSNAYKTMFLGGGADVTVVGADMQQVDFKVTQGAGETRIAAAAEVPPVIVGLSEGLDAATYSNYQLAMRRFVDVTMRPLWRIASASLAPIIAVPSDAELWYDDRNLPALYESAKDAASIQQVQSVAIKQLTDAGFDAESVIQAITNNDLSRLSHTGLFSVQLQPPGTEQPAISQNGNAPALRELAAAVERRIE